MALCLFVILSTIVYNCSRYHDIVLIHLWLLLKQLISGCSYHNIHYFLVCTINIVMYVCAIKKENVVYCMSVCLILISISYSSTFFCCLPLHSQCNLTLNAAVFIVLVFGISDGRRFLYVLCYHHYQIIWRDLYCSITIFNNREQVLLQQAQEVMGRKVGVLDRQQEEIQLVQTTLNSLVGFIERTAEMRVMKSLW